MPRWNRCAILAPLAVLATAATAADDDIGNTITWLEARPRYNHIEESDLPRTSSGATMRILAGLRLAPYRHVQLTAELIHAGHPGRKRFNDDPSQLQTSPYPLLPDPRHAGVNQAHVEYDGIEGLRLRAGRQRVALDNRRWVSENDFRQIPLLFDGLTATYTGLAGAALTAGHYRKLRATSGRREDAKVTVVHAAWNPADGHSVSAYAYFHDQPRTAHFVGFANNSQRVVGALAEGVAARIGGIDVAYTIEAAVQKPHAGGDARIDARYWRVGAGAATAAWTVRADYEVRGSNRGLYGLQAPLTDFYAFNGWTLVWFTAPREGLRDGWITGRLAVGPVTLYAEAHRFRSDHGRMDLGRELDAGVTLELLPNAILRLQHARYDAGSGRPDPAIRKTWLTLTYTY